MTFDSTLFVWFFVLVVGVYWALSRFAVARLWWLMLASVAFYGAWDPRFLVLIGASTVLDWFAALRIDRAGSARTRKLWLAASLLGNLGLLAVFKYGTFVLTQLDAAAGALGAGHVPIVQIVVPVGISFYTFQTLSYTIDVYRGTLKPARSPLHFALFVVFFPQLVAGPIVRAADLLPQFDSPPPRDVAREGAGLFLMLVGLTKKVAIADWLALNLVDRVFDNPELFSSIETLVAVWGYALQIYCDFSGYSDVAIGAALVLGYTLTDNFDRPYVSASIQEFWRRWHISLSTWLRDYLYIPLGGNRGGTVATYRNLIVTMLLGGLWHGANWTFVAWGAWHGVGLAVERAVRGARIAPPSTWLGTWTSRFLVFHFVCAGWVLFRAPDFASARAVLVNLGALTTYAPNLGPKIVLVVAGVLVWHQTPRSWMTGLRTRFAAMPALAQAAVAVAVCIALQQLKGTAAVPFIYFQF